MRAWRPHSALPVPGCGRWRALATSPPLRTRSMPPPVRRQRRNWRLPSAHALNKPCRLALVYPLKRRAGAMLCSRIGIYEF